MKTSGRLVHAWMLAILVLHAGPAAADTFPLVGKFLGTPSTAGPTGHLGNSVAVSGETLAAGSIGAARVFTRSGGAWSLQALLASTDGGPFGDSIAIDGDTILVGGPEQRNGFGAAYVFTRSNGIWSQQAKLFDVTATSIKFGASVALTSDTAIIGAPGFGGKVFLFTRTGNSWNGPTTVVSPNPKSDKFGASVAATSSTIAISDPWVNEAYTYIQTAGVWTLQQSITVGDPSVTDGFGDALALSGDTLIVGTDAAYVFTRSGGVWSPQAKLANPNPGSFNSFGSSVAVSGDAAVVGAPSQGSGAAYFFTRAGGVWTQRSVLTPSDGGPLDAFAHSVAVSDTIMVGSFSNANNAGAVYLYATSPANVVLLSSPMGRSFTLSGPTCPSPGTFFTPYSGLWTECIVQWTSPDSPSVGTRYTFQSWKDGSLQNPRDIVAPPSQTDYSADFLTEYQLTTQALPVSGGAVSSAGWYSSGAGATVVAIPNPGFVFNGFGGALTGLQTPQVLAMSGPGTVTGVFLPTPPAVLSGSVTSKSGTPADRAWTITLTNTGPGVAYNAQFLFLTFTQTFGTPCASPPVRLSPASLPVGVGTLSPGGSAQTPVAVDFSACPLTARFTVNAGYLSNGGASGGMIQLVNQFQ